MKIEVTDHAIHRYRRHVREVGLQRAVHAIERDVATADVYGKRRKFRLPAHGRYLACVQELPGDVVRVCTILHDRARDYKKCVKLRNSKSIARETVLRACEMMARGRHGQEVAHALGVLPGPLREAVLRHGPKEMIRLGYDTEEAIQFIAERADSWRTGTIAKHLGCCEHAVRRIISAWGLAPQDQDWMTVPDAARLAGISENSLRRKASHGIVRAKKIPGKRFWIVDPATLPIQDEAARPPGWTGTVMVTTREASDITGYTRDWMYRMYVQGKLTGKRIGINVWLHRDQLFRRNEPAI